MSIKVKHHNRAQVDMIYKSRNVKQYKKVEVEMIYKDRKEITIH